MLIKADCKGLGNFDLKKELSSICGDVLKSDKTLNVGFFENSKYENGLYVAQVAFWQEYGTARIPLRPFMRKAISANKKKWFALAEAGFKKGENIDIIFGKIGEVAKGDCVLSLTQLNSPANAKSTIKLKKSSKPLIDSGFMRSNITFKIGNKYV